MKPTSNMNRPWTINFSYRVPSKVFGLIRALLKTELEGAVCEFTETKATWKILMRSIETLKSLFFHARPAGRRTVPSDNDMELLKEFPKMGHAQILINNEKDFILSYSRNLEVLRVQCHYGFWNSAGFPQHFVGNQ